MELGIISKCNIMKKGQYKHSEWIKLIKREKEKLGREYLERVE